MSCFTWRAVRHMCTDQRRHRDGGSDREETFPQRLIGCALEHECGADADEDREYAMPQRTAGISSWRPALRRYARLMATMRNASRPSRRVMTND